MADLNDRVDDIRVALNPESDDAVYDNLPALSRPPASALRDAWADYCVKLGKDAADVEGTKAELIELADRLGG